MAIKEAKQQHPDMLVTKAIVVRETESSTQDTHEQFKVLIIISIPRFQILNNPFSLTIFHSAVLHMGSFHAGTSIIS